MSTDTPERDPNNPVHQPEPDQPEPVEPEPEPEQDEPEQDEPEREPGGDDE